MKINNNIFENKEVKVLSNLIQNMLDNYQRNLEEGFDNMNSRFDLKINELKTEIMNLKEEIKEMKSNKARTNIALLTAGLSFLISFILLIIQGKL